MTDNSKRSPSVADKELAEDSARREPLVEITGLGHDYAHGRSVRRVLDNVTLTAAAAEFICIVGPSGVGKTTLLRCIAGLQIPTRGTVRIDGAALCGPSSSIGLVFQDYSRSLMPWMSVLDNVTLPLQGRIPRAERIERATWALQEVGLSASSGNRPWQLSGGMQQRVAIARALAYGPKVLLMDEPFASLDAQTRADLEDLTLRVRNDAGQVMILITHDIDESLYLADRIVVLGGSPATVVQQIDVPLGKERDQIATKARPEFGELRAQVHALIRNPAA